LIILGGMGHSGEWSWLVQRLRAFSSGRLWWFEFTRWWKEIHYYHWMGFLFFFI